MRREVESVLMKNIAAIWISISSNILTLDKNWIPLNKNRVAR
jgi:hypothetical protein